MVSISNIEIANKLVWKILLSLAFSIATLCVGFMYSTHFLRSRTSGGKVRTNIFIFLVVLLCTVAPFIAVVVDISMKILLSLIALTLTLSLIFGVYKLLSFIKNKNTNKNIHTQESSVPSPKIQPILFNQNTNSNLSQSEVRSVSVITETPLATLYELAQNYDFSKGCMTATNDENPNLKWVKIYKPPYSNGKFYGYVMMKNAHNTVNGEIYYANKSIWRLA